MSPRMIRMMISFALVAAAAQSAAGFWDWAQSRRDQTASVTPDLSLSAATEISGWPAKARALATALIQEHGAPDEISAAQLTWHNRSPWNMIAVFRDAESAERPNNLLQSVAYEVSPRRWRTLSAFDRFVAYEPVRRELTARSDGEATNILALNLADEVIQGRRTPADAAAFYDRTVELSYAGKSSPYMRKLMFSPLTRRYFQKDSARDLQLDREINRIEKSNDRP
jgi:hypothetical protein